MDICDDILDENDRYAFLLGSALRNKEPDNFLEIYDKVIPKDLEEKELEEIKEKARHLANVSEDEFGQIAARARDYSLAQPGGLYDPPTMLDSETTEEICKIECMRGTASVSSVSSLTSDVTSDPFSYMEKPGLSSLKRTSRHFGPHSEASEISVSDASDSGIYLNSSKLDCEADQDDSGRPGVFDYYTKSCYARSMEPQIEIVTVKNMSDYNERFSPHPSTATTHKVNLTDRSGGRITVHDPRLFDSNSDNEVSPRSEGDEGGHPRAKFNREIEMVNLRKGSESPDPEMQSLLHPEEMKYRRKEVRRHNNQVYDEAFIVEDRSVSSMESSASSGEELQQIVVKNPDSDVDISYVNVHSRLYDSHDNHFCSTTQDFSEDYDLEDDDDPARALKRLSDSIPNSYEREVKFRSANHYGAPRSYGSFNRDSQVDRGVNFGLNSSLSSGVRVERHMSSKPTQPPFGDPLKLERVGYSNSRLLKGRMGAMETKNMPDAEVIKPEGKRKKKRKKKEETEEKSDINGNPLEEGRARSLNKQVEPYKSDPHIYTESRYPSRLESFDAGGYIMNNESMMQSVDQQKFQEKKARKNKKKELRDKGVIEAENIPGHRWDDDVDALLNFIEGDKGSTNHHSNAANQRKQQSQQKNRFQLSPQQTQTVGNPSLNQTPHVTENGMLGPADRTAVGLSEVVTRSREDEVPAQTVGNIIPTNTPGPRKEGRSKKKKGRSSSIGSISKENSEDSLRDITSEAGSVSDAKETVTMAVNSAESTSVTNVAENGSGFLPEEGKIFTDFEGQKPAQRESEFQTVSSRKKKKQQQQVAKETDNVRVFSNNGGLMNGFASNGGENYRKISNSAREYVSNFRQRQNFNKYNNSAEKRSYTPPPTPTSVVDTDKPHARAFSPSAFPALAKQGVGSASTTTGGRRNSTGNVIELEVEKEDSDLESCKSAPASKPGDSVNTEVVRQIPGKVSYAKVLGGKQLDGRQPDTPERERRHSLGNLPISPAGQLDPDRKQQSVARSQELGANNTEHMLSSGVSSLSSSSKASSLANSKYSSIENLTARESSPVSESVQHTSVATSINPSSETDFPPMPSNSIVCSSSANTESSKHISQATDSQNRWSQPPPLVSSSQSSQSSSNSSNTKTVSQSETNPPQKADSLLNRCNPSQTAPPVTQTSLCNMSNSSNSVVATKTTTIPSDARKASRTVINSGVGSNSTNTSGKTVNTKARTNASQVANHSKTQVNNRKMLLTGSSTLTSNAKTSKTTATTTQSVIFLDRKFSEETHNFEISFGFEPSLESAESSSPSEVEEVNNMDSTSVITESAVPSNQSRGLPSSHVIRTDSDKCAPMTTQSPPNGIVVNPPISLNAVPSGIRPLVTDPQGVSIKDDTRKESCTPQEVVLAESKDLSNETTETLQFGVDQEMFKRGSSGSVVSTYVLPTLPSRDQDPNYQRGKFDQERIVSYIYNEWCNVMQEGDKVRDSVVVYGRDLT